MLNIYMQLIKYRIMEIQLLRANTHHSILSIRSKMCN